MLNNLKLKTILILSPWTGKIGPNTFLKDMVRGLFSSGYQVSLIYPYTDEVSNDLVQMGCEIHYLPQLKLKHINNFFFKIASRIYGEIILFCFLFAKIRSKNFKYCIVNSEVLSFSLFALTWKMPTYVVVHSLSFTENKKLSNLIFNIQKSRVSKYLAVSNAVKRALESMLIKTEVMMVYNGVDTNYYDKGISIYRVSKTIQILSVLHPVPHKGAHHLINTLALIRDKGYNYKCTIVGWFNDSSDLHYINSITQKISKNNLEKLIHLQPPGIDMRKNYMCSDILLHPSENESFGYVLAEAMASELPVVAFEVGGIPEVVEHNVTGYLIPPYDTEFMAEMTIKLMESEDLRSRLGQNGRNRVKDRFTSEKNIGSLLQMLELEM